MKAHYKGQLAGSRILIKWQLHLQKYKGALTLGWLDQRLWVRHCVINLFQSLHWEIRWQYIRNPIIIIVWLMRPIAGNCYFYVISRLWSRWATQSGARCFPVWPPWGRCSPSAWISSDPIGFVCSRRRHAVPLEALCLWWAWTELCNRNTCLAPVDGQAFAVWIPLEVWGAAGGCCWAQVSVHGACISFPRLRRGKESHTLSPFQNIKMGGRLQVSPGVLC